jgi:hypothetical protein
VKRFGTLTPKAAAVRVASDELTSFVAERFSAVWLMALDESGVACVCFVGVSGDRGSASAP